MKNLRIQFARFLLQVGDFFQTLPVVVMKPDDLVEFSRQSYSKSTDVEAWADDRLVDSGFSEDELDLIREVPNTEGDLLLLGVGGGREAIPLAKMGFRVTGVDYVPAMVERAIQNASHRGVYIDGLVQDISHLEVQAELYDVVLISRAMYSCVPTRKRRVDMVQRICRALKPNGIFLCQSHWETRLKNLGWGDFIRRVIAVCTLGNHAYETGDMLWLKVEFIHAFASEDKLKSELEQGGFTVTRIRVDNQTHRASAVCIKKPG